MWIALIFMAVPLVEIGLFVLVGGAIGLWWTLALVVLSAIAGTALIRRQGLRTLDELRRSFEEMRDPTAPIAHGAMILLAGAFLLTPGFFTDSLGLLLMVPQVRAGVIALVARRISVVSGGAFRRPGADADVIDASYRDVTPAGDAPGGRAIEGRRTR